MSVRFYEQSWYKYRIRIGAHVLICRNLQDRVVDGVVGPTRIRDGLDPPVNNTGRPNQRTKPKIWVETLLALLIYILGNYARALLRTKLV